MGQKETRAGGQCCVLPLGGTGVNGILWDNRIRLLRSTANTHTHTGLMSVNVTGANATHLLQTHTTAPRPSKHYSLCLSEASRVGFESGHAYVYIRWNDINTDLNTDNHPWAWTENRSLVHRHTEQRMSRTTHKIPWYYRALDVMSGV